MTRDFDIVWLGHSKPARGRSSSASYYLAAMDAAGARHTFVDCDAGLKSISKERKEALYRAGRPVLAFFDLHPDSLDNIDSSGNVFKIMLAGLDCREDLDSWRRQALGMDEIWTPYIFCFQALVQNGIPFEKIRVMPLCVKPPPRLENLEPLPVNGKTGFTFLSVVGEHGLNKLPSVLRSFYTNLTSNIEQCILNGN